MGISLFFIVIMVNPIVPIITMKNREIPIRPTSPVSSLSSERQGRAQAYEIEKRSTYRGSWDLLFLLP
jgi:hypothetical protein